MLHSCGVTIGMISAVFGKVGGGGGGRGSGDVLDPAGISVACRVLLHY